MSRTPRPAHTRRNPNPMAYLAANSEARVMATLMPEQLWSQAAGAGSEWAMWELARRGQTVPWVRTNPDSPSDAVEDAEWYLSLPQNTDEYQRLNVYENCCRKHGKTAFNKVLNDAIAAYHERKARRNPGPPMSSRPHNWQAWTYSQQTAWGEGYRDGVHESPNYAWTTSPDYNHYNAGIQQGSMERLKNAGTLGRFGLANPSGPKPGDSVNMVGRLKDSKSDGRYYTGDHVTLVNRHGEFVIAVEQIHRQLGGIQNDTRLIGTLISVKAKNNPSTDDCSRCDGTGYAGPHGDTCSRCEGSGVDARQRCEGGCGKTVRESQGMCRPCSNREDEENGITRDAFGYAIRRNPKLAAFISDGRGLRAKDLTIEGSGPRGGYTSQERERVPSNMFLKPGARSWPVGNKKHAFLALQYMTRGFGSRAEYPYLILRLSELWPVDANADVWSDYSAKKKGIEKMCGCVMPSVDQLRSR